MIAQHGNYFDYQGWADATGDDSYSYENMLKYFQKLEDYDGGFQGEVVQYINKQRTSLLKYYGSVLLIICPA